MVSDKSLGTLGLFVSCTMLAYMFFHLMVLPVLPLDDDNPLKLLPPAAVVLGICGFLGFAFIGTLLAYTFLILYTGKVHICK